VDLAALPHRDPLVEVDDGAAAGRPDLGDQQGSRPVVLDHEVVIDLVALRHRAHVLDRLGGHGLGLAGGVGGQRERRDEHEGAQCQNGGS